MKKLDDARERHKMLRAQFAALPKEKQDTKEGHNLRCRIGELETRIAELLREMFGDELRDLPPLP